MNERQPIFGRKSDLQALLDRIGRPGLTSIVGRPQVGKTRLLQELRDTLRGEVPADEALPFDGDYLVGYIECGAAGDTFLRCLQDLYAHWLGNSTYFEQARQVYDQQKGKLPVSVAPTVGKLLTNFLPVEALRTPVHALFTGLAQANLDLKTGELTLPPLSYDQGRYLAQSVVKLAGRRVVLILDNFEQSMRVAEEVALLRRVVGHLGEWPECHFIVGLRDTADDDAYAAAQEFAAASARANLHDLGGMQLTDDAGALLQYLRERVPATAKLSDSEVLGLIDNHAGVFSRFLEEPVEDVPALRQLAADAHSYRYREFDAIFPQLRTQYPAEISLTSRLLLIAPLTSAEEWSELAQVLGGEESEETVVELLRRRVLVRSENLEGFEHGTYPSFGHITRRSAAFRSLLTHDAHGLEREARQLISVCLSRISDAHPSERPFVVSLAAMAITSSVLRLPDALRQICACALSLISPGFAPAPEKRDLKRLRATVKAVPESRVLIGLLLAKTLNAWKALNKPEIVVQLLEELKWLGKKYDRDLTVKRTLARTLVNAAASTSEEDWQRHLGFLADLRALTQTDCECPEIQHCMAIALANSASSPAERGDWSNAQLFLMELREFSIGKPDNADIRHQLGRALLVHIHFSLREATQDGRSEDVWRSGFDNVMHITEELRLLSHAHHDDSQLRETFSQSLLELAHAAAVCREKDDEEGALAELRNLCALYVDDTNTRAHYAKALFNSSRHAQSASAWKVVEERHQALLTLSSSYPSDTVVLEYLSHSLRHAATETAHPTQWALQQSLLEATPRDCY